MFTLQPEAAAVAGVSYALRIMGMDLLTFTFLLAFLITASILFVKLYFIPDLRRKKYIQLTKESVLLEICPIGGGKVKRVLAPVYKGTAKEIRDKNGSTFFISEYAKMEGGDADGYYLIPGHGKMDEYPYDVPENQRVPILKYYYYENDPFPQMPDDPEKWNVEMRTNVTSSFARLSREESVAKTLIGQFSGFFEGLMKALPSLQKIPMIFILQIVILGITAMLVFFIYRSGQDISTIKMFLTGGG